MTSPIHFYNDNLRPLPTVRQVQHILRKNAYIGKAACGLYGAIFDFAGGIPEENACAVLSIVSTTFEGAKWRLTGYAFIAKIVGRERQVLGCHWPVGCALLISLWNKR